MKFLALTFAFLAACAPAAAQSSALSAPTNVFARTAKSVWQVHTTLAFASEANGLQFSEWIGTAWTLESNGERSVLVTAGHVCEQAGDPDPEGTSEKIFAVSMRVTHEASPKEYPVTLIQDSNDEVNDTCLIVVDLDSPALSLADSEPSLGQRVLYVGYPAGSFAMVEGHYTGVTSDGYTGASLTAAGGASGSPVLTDDGKVYGMLVLANTRFPTATYEVRLKWLRALRVPALAALGAY